MSVVLFLAPLPPPVHGSALVSEFVFNIVKADNEVIYVDTGSKKVLSSYDSDLLQKLVHGSKRLFKVLMAVVRHNGVIYFTPAINGLAFWRDILILLAVFFKKNRSKSILHMHNKGLEFLAIKRFIFNKLSGNSTIIVLSESLSNPYNQSNIKIIKNFPIEFSDVDLSRKNRGNEIYVGYLSNYILAKGVLTFIDIASNIKDERFRLSTVGNDADCSSIYLRGEVFKRKLNNVSIYDAKYGKDKFNYLSSLDFLLFPTRYKNECCPLVLLEAITCGVVVIAFNEGGIKDILPKDSMCLVNSENEMLTTLMTLSNSSELFVKERESQRVHVKVNFNKESFVAEIKSLFESVKQR